MLRPTTIYIAPLSIFSFNILLSSEAFFFERPEEFCHFHFFLLPHPYPPYSKLPFLPLCTTPFLFVTWTTPRLLPVSGSLLLVTIAHQGQSGTSSSRNLQQHVTHGPLYCSLQRRPNHKGAHYFC